MFKFPIAYALNFSSVTILMIILSLSGQSILSADLAILGAITFFIFQSFSGNSRNILLNKSLVISYNEVIKIRLILVLPLILFVYFITNSLSEINFYLILLVTLRKIIDWLDDLYLIKQEDQSNTKKLHYYIIFQILAIIALLLSIFIYSNTFIGILFWSITPIFLTIRFYFTYINKELFLLKIKNLKLFMPHLSSTVIIGISLYIFRLLIINLTGKEIAGDLFTAFASGGLLGTFIANSFGPTLVRFMNENKILTIPFKYQICFLFFILAGLCIIYLSFTIDKETIFLEKTLYFWKAIGFSMIGGGIMAYAQITKTYILQHTANFNIMGLEIVYNLTLISIIPLSSFFVTIDFLPSVYLLSSVLALSLYKTFQFNNIDYKNFFNKLKPYLSSLIVIFLLVPIFFQLKGNILLDVDFNKLNPSQSIFSLPLPVSLICLPLVFLVYSEYDKAKLGFFIIFFTLIIMSLSILFQDYKEWGNLQNKFVSIIQFIIPFFGFVIYYFICLENKSFEKKLYKIILLFLFLFLPLQLTASFFNEGFRSHSSDLFLFSIYQNNQYVPKINLMLIFIGICMTIYVQLTSLLLAKIFFVAGLSLFLLCQLFLYKKYISTIYALLLLTIFFVMPTLISKLKNEINEIENKSKVTEIKKQPNLFEINKNLRFFYFSLSQHKDVNDDRLMYGEDIFQHQGTESLISSNSGYISKIYQKFPQIKERVIYWNFYSKKIIESPNKFLFGQKIILDKGDFINFKSYNEKAITFSSAHNYYLDLIFHFGIISLIPLGYLLSKLSHNFIYLLRNKKILMFKESGQIIMLSFIIFYFFCIENILLTSLKQPFSGIFIFFIFALLYNKILLKNINSR